MANKYDEVVNYIKELESIEKTIDYQDEDGEVVFTLTVNEQVDFENIFQAINDVVDNVVEQEFAYELIDLMLPYYQLSFFTDIEPPVLKDEDGEEYPDFVQCYKIATYLNLEYELTQVSPLVAGYIYNMTQNIWRKLEYKKSEGAYIKNQLTDALVHFYEVMDEIDEVVAQEKNVDVEGFISKLNEMTEQLNLLNKEDEAVDPEAKSSVELAVIDDSTK